MSTIKCLHQRIVEVLVRCFYRGKSSVFVSHKPTEAIVASNQIVKKPRYPPSEDISISSYGMETTIKREVVPRPNSTLG
jgi:hypothetical protein